VNHTSYNMAKLPQKKYYRQRAHANPIADHCFDYPVNPSSMDWTELYPSTVLQEKRVENLDIGCGYGGLLIALAKTYPDMLSLGIEIRVKVSDFVRDRIKAMRDEYPNTYDNIACIRSNAMKYLPNYFHKGQLKRLFFLFPDPHFKKHKHKWRVISEPLLAEYAYVLMVGGIAYFATDVEELYEWMDDHFKAHPLFEAVEEHNLIDDPIQAQLFDCTEEGKKVTRAGGKKYLAAYKRVCDPYEISNPS